jgi:hypothetical protein
VPVTLTPSSSTWKAVLVNVPLATRSAISYCRAWAMSTVWASHSPVSKLNTEKPPPEVSRVTWMSTSLVVRYWLPALPATLSW